MFFCRKMFDSEIEINEWLKENPYIKIEHATMGQYNADHDILIALFYSTRKDKLENLEDLSNLEN